MTPQELQNMAQHAISIANGLQQTVQDLMTRVTTLEGEKARLEHEMNLLRTASNSALSGAKQAAEKAKKTVADIENRMDDLEDEQTKFADEVKKAVEDSQKALEESEKKNQPIVVHTSQGWNYGQGEWYQGGWTSHHSLTTQVGTMVNELKNQGITCTTGFIQDLMREVAGANDYLEKEHNYLLEEENKNAND